MPKAQPAAEAEDLLTIDQLLRDKYMTILLDRPNPPSVQNAMLMVGPAVDFILANRVLGVDRIDEDQAPAKRKKTGSSAIR